jgi:hypothetical protein
MDQFLDTSGFPTASMSVIQTSDPNPPRRVFFVNYRFLLIMELPGQPVAQPAKVYQRLH